MAERRMISRTFLDSDMFLDLPLTAQALYLHLCVRADDDGAVDNAKRIVRSVCAKEEDLQLLISNNLLISFDSGIIVITHWGQHNRIRKDRHQPSRYQAELRTLTTLEDGSYQTADNQVATNDGQVTTKGGQASPQYSVVKDSVVKDSKGKCSKGNKGTPKFKHPTIEEIRQYIKESGINVDAERFFDYYTANGWKVGKNPMKDWRATIRNWERNNARDNTGSGSQRTGNNGARADKGNGTEEGSGEEWTKAFPRMVTATS